MEGLETLTDQQLKTKLMEFGFANLPITDTTRKVLLKKLKNAIDGQKVKNRRETVAVTKFSSDEEVELVDSQKPRAKTPNNRRATIAVAEKLSTSVKKSASNGTTTTTSNGTNGVTAVDTPAKTKTPSRRTSRATPAQHLQDSDDDDVPLISQVAPTRRSMSRTATPTNLGVSETVRTAYKQSETLIEEAEIVFEEVAEPVVSKSTRRKTITTSSSNLPERSTPTNFRRTTITTSYNPRNASQYTDEAEQVQQQPTVEINEATTPYLSNFAKRLSTLKAEPLDPGMQKYRESSYTSYPRTSVAAAATTSSSSTSQYRKPQGGIMSDMTKTFDRLEKRYRFRTTLYVIAIVLIVIAIYVLFFT